MKHFTKQLITLAAVFGTTSLMALTPLEKAIVDQAQGKDSKGSVKTALDNKVSHYKSLARKAVKSGPSSAKGTMQVLIRKEQKEKADHYTNLAEKYSKILKQL